MGPFSREHIVPAGLSGEYTIQDASCGACAKETSQFEREVLRDCLQAQRAALGLRSRRKKDAPLAYPAVVSSPTAEIHNEVSASELPAIVPLLVFSRPDADRVDVKILDFAFINAEEASQRALELAVSTVPEDEFGTGAERSVELQVRVRPVPFARLIAKIGYCFAVSEHGAAALNAADLVAFILGDSEHAGAFVGSSHRPLERSEVLHTYSIADTGERLHVFFRLFASYGGPEYEVIVRKRSLEA